MPVLIVCYRNSCEYEPKAGETGKEPDNRVAAPEDRRDDELATAEALLELHGKTPLNQELDPIMKVDKAVQFDENLFKARKYNSVLELIRNERDLNTLTGMPHMAALDALVRCVEKLEIERFSMPLKERIMLTMMKLKLDLSFRTLSVFFQCSATTSQNYFHDVIRKLSRVLSVLIRWPDKEEIMRNMPQCFNKYKKTRIVLDCTEVQTEKTNCLKCRISTYSHYKGRNTVKFLIGVAPSGLITYVSRGFGGRFSDKSIFNLSGLLEKLDPHNDAIMVDKGFLIANECFESSIPLIMPPFLRKKKQFTQEEAELTVSIAAARVHVERTIQRVKIFAILTNNLDTFLVPYIDEIAIVICAIVNMSPPILAIDKY